MATEEKLTDAERDQLVADAYMEEQLTREAPRLRDELELAYEVLAAELDLTLDGVRALMTLHRRSRGVSAGTFTADDVLAGLGQRWWPTGIIARALLPGGGSGLTASQRSDHRDRVMVLLRELLADGRVQMRRVSGGRVVARGDAGRGRNEWRRT